jgi:hypothetical protein
LNKAIVKLKTKYIAMSTTQQNQSAELTEGVNKTALRIAQEYLKAHPREYSYPVTIGSYDDGYNPDIYLKFNEDELKVLKAWMDLGDKQQDYANLEDYLMETGHDDLLNRIITETDGCVNGTSRVDDCDINQKLQLLSVT